MGRVGGRRRRGRGGSPEIFTKWTQDKQFYHGQRFAGSREHQQMSGQIILAASIKHSKATLSKKKEKKNPQWPFLSESVCLLESPGPAERRTHGEGARHGEKWCTHAWPKQQRTPFNFLRVVGGRGVKTFQAEVPGVCSSGRTTSRPRGRLAHTLEREWKRK